jgi:hypothetical protein
VCVCLTLFLSFALSLDHSLTLCVQSLEGLLDAMVDGVILAKLINQTKPGTINEALLKTDLIKALTGSDANAQTKAVFGLSNNLELVLQGARAIGCKVRAATTVSPTAQRPLCSWAMAVRGQFVGIAPTDIIEKKEELVLGVIWQVLRVHLMKSTPDDRTGPPPAPRPSPAPPAAKHTHTHTHAGKHTHTDTQTHPLSLHAHPSHRCRTRRRQLAPPRPFSCCCGLHAGVNMFSHPELIRLLKKGESLGTLMEMAAEEVRRARAPAPSRCVPDAFSHGPLPGCLCVRMHALCGWVHLSADSAAVVQLPAAAGGPRTGDQQLWRGPQGRRRLYCAHAPNRAQEGRPLSHRRSPGQYVGRSFACSARMR